MTTPTLDYERPDWATTRALIRSDWARLLASMDQVSLPRKLFWFLFPNWQCLLQYRLYRWLYVRGFRNLAQLGFLVNLYMTRVDIPPRTIIGPGALIAHPAGIALYGRIGANFTAFGEGAIGGGTGEGDIGGGPGLPVIGDDVVFAFRSVVLGPVRVGDGVRIGPGCVVTRDVPPGSTVMEAPPRIVPPWTPSDRGAAAAPPHREAA